jgi:hypothetical protein
MCVSVYWCRLLTQASWYLEMVMVSTTLVCQLQVVLHLLVMCVMDGYRGGARGRVLTEIPKTFRVMVGVCHFTVGAKLACGTY